MRAFAAIPLPAAFAGWLESYRQALSDRQAGIRLVPAASCHMTLRFLGEVPRVQLDEMVHSLSSSLAGTAPIEMVLDQTGMFLRDGRPAVLWLGPSRVPPGLTALASKVDRALSGFGSNSRSEHFTPHVTLGRFVSGGPVGETAPIPMAINVSPFAVSVRSVVLFESVLGQGRPLYVARAAVALGDLPNGATELY